MPKGISEEKKSGQEELNPEFKFFPILSDKKSKYHKNNSAEFLINFGDVIYIFHAAAMHYLVDHDSLGWSLMPPDDLIDRIMKGGKFTFDYTPVEQLTLPAEAIGCLRKRKLKNQKDYQIYDNENKVPAKLGKAPDYFIERLEKIIAAISNKDKSIELQPHPDYVGKFIPKRPETELCFCHNRFKKLFYQDQEKGIDIRETKGKIHLTDPKDLKRYRSGVIDLKSLFDSEAPYTLAGHLRFVAVTDSMAYCDLKTALSFELENHSKFAEFILKYEDGINYLREIFNRLFKNFNIEFDTSFAFAKSNPQVLVARGENLTRLKEIGAKLIPSQNVKPVDKLYLAFGVTPQKCVIEKDLIEIGDPRGLNHSFSYLIYNQPGMIKGEDCQSTVSTWGIAIDNKGVGDRFSKLLQDKMRNHNKIVNTLYSVEHGGLCYRASMSIYHLFCCRKPIITDEKNEDLQSSVNKITPLTSKI